MKVKITKCNKDSYWHNKQIGKVYEVENTFYTNNYKVVNSLKLIDKKDCEIIK